MSAALEIASVFASVRRFPPPRRRGGQPGSRNRLKHGGFSRAIQKRREATAASSGTWTSSLRRPKPGTPANRQAVLSSWNAPLAGTPPASQGNYHLD